MNKMNVQWGSEYQTSLVFEWLKVVRSPNGLLFECHLNTGLNFVRYSDHHLNTGQVKVRYSDVSVIQMFVIQIPAVVEIKDLLFRVPSLRRLWRVVLEFAQVIIAFALQFKSTKLFVRIQMRDLTCAEVS